MTPDSAIWAILLPMVLLGIGNAFVWAPNSATATRNLPIQQAGAGAGVYNATRQVGAVLGSAAIAVLIDSRLAAEGLPSFSGRGRPAAAACRRGRRGVQRRDGDGDAAARRRCCVLGLVAVLFFERPRHAGYAAGGPPPDRCRAARRPGRTTTARSAVRPTRAGGQAETDLPGRARFSQASTTRAAMPASAALPQARGS